MNARIITAVVVSLGWALAPAARAQDPQEEPQGPSFTEASASVQKRLEEGLKELAALRNEIKDEKLPLSRRLRELETELTEVRIEYQQQTRLVETRALDLTNLRSEIKGRDDEVSYLSNLLSDYIRNFDSGLHIAEVHRYEEPLETARLAPEDNALSQQEIFEAQAALLQISLGRLHEALGGTKFDGAAVDPDGLVAKGSFVLVGPAALFRSADGQKVGTAEQRLGSLEPAAIAFGSETDTEAAAALVEAGEGVFPLDPTLGNAHKIEATSESFIEHVQKGGAVMVPIFVMAAAALLVALYKWIALALIRKPTKQQLIELTNAVEQHDEPAAAERAAAIKGPVGEMLQAGVEHIREPRELIEEVMYETVLKTRLQTQRLLPFIAICAASAPLLGLLGTVTGIINTFKLITVFGSGDVKTLSGGISEALITTKFGLIVAIPSLLLHAFLSRKARGVVSSMETAAVAFVNQVSKTPFQQKGLLAGAEESSSPSAEVVRTQVIEALRDIVGSGRRTDRGDRATADAPVYEMKPAAPASVETKSSAASPEPANARKTPAS